jgi:hypothetical protein
VAEAELLEYYVEGQDKDRAKASRKARHSKNKNEEAQTLSGPPLPPQREPKTERQKKVAGKESTTTQPGDSPNDQFERALAEMLEEAQAVPVVSRAPKPASSIRHGFCSPPPELIRQPRELPTGYPDTLELRTWAVINEAKEKEKFPRQSQLLDFCKEVLAKLTPDLCGEVQAARLQGPRAVSHLDGLLDSLLFYNENIESARDNLRQEMKRSKEWAAFIRELSRAEQQARHSPQSSGEVKAPKLERLQDGDETSPANPLREPKQKGRPPTARRAIYEEAAAYKDAHNEISWGQLAKKYFPNEYRDDPKRCSDRVRMGVKRLKQAKRS